MSKETEKPIEQPHLILRRDWWIKGYFCALAIYIKENCAEGCHDAPAKSVFQHGGDWSLADPDDIETLRLHGLINAEHACLSHGEGEKRP